MRSERFLSLSTIYTGVKQGCCLTMLAFCLAMDPVLEASQTHNEETFTPFNAVRRQKTSEPCENKSLLPYPRGVHGRHCRHFHVATAIQQMLFHTHFSKRCMWSHRKITIVVLFSSIKCSSLSATRRANKQDLLTALLIQPQQYIQIALLT